MSHDFYEEQQLPPPRKNVPCFIRSGIAPLKMILRQYSSSTEAVSYNVVRRHNGTAVARSTFDRTVARYFLRAWAVFVDRTVARTVARWIDLVTLVTVNIDTMTVLQHYNFTAIYSKSTTDHPVPDFFAVVKVAINSWCTSWEKKKSG